MSGQIFISYRRGDASYPAVHLYERLSAHFAQNQIFMDIDNLEPGVDFVEAIQKSVSGCDVLVAIIGKRWLSAADEEGKRRLDNPEDFVRTEIGTALKRGIRVIPVLVEGALMPRATDLPDDLKALVRRQALSVSPDRFRDDSGRLIGAVERALEGARVETQRKREEQERVEAARREREAKERLEAGQRAQAQQARLKAEQQPRAEQECAETDQRLQAERREKERLKAEHCEAETRGHSEAECRVPRQNKTEALEGIEGASRGPPGSHAPPEEDTTKLKNPWRMLVAIGTWRMLVVIGSGVAVVLLSFSLYYSSYRSEISRPRPVFEAPLATPVRPAAPTNSPSPTPSFSQALPSLTPSSAEALAAPASPVPVSPAAPTNSPSPTPSVSQASPSPSPSGVDWFVEYQKAAEAGDAQSMNNLGLLYEKGLGVTQDYAQARHWYQKAAEAGNTDAMTNLGWLYQKGLDGAQDYAQAREWYQKAADEGNGLAMNNLGWLYQKGLGGPQDYAQARQWYQKAADKGNARGMYNLGYFYEKGLGGARDYAQARQWYERAVDAGDPSAKQALSRLPSK